MHAAVGGGVPCLVMVPLVSVSVCCLLVESYAWECFVLCGYGAGGYLFEFGITGLYAIPCNCKEYYNFITVFCFRFRLGVAV